MSTKAYFNRLGYLYVTKTTQAKIEKIKIYIFLYIKQFDFKKLSLILTRLGPNILPVSINSLSELAVNKLINLNIGVLGWRS